MTTTTQPQTPQRFGLPESAIQAIQRVLAAHPEVEQAIVYGSRAMGRQRPASDIDLTLIGAAIGFGTLARIEDELDDLLLPWMIDLSSLADLSHPPRRWARLNRSGPSMLGASNACDTTKQRQAQYAFTYGSESGHGHGVCHGSPQAVVCADR